MSTNNKGIRNGKSGQTWSLQWVTDSGTREYRKITLTEDVTKAVMLGRKPLKYMKDGKNETMINISHINGAEWNLLPELKRSSSPVLPEKVKKMSTKKLPYIEKEPSFSPVSPGDEKLPSLVNQSAFISSSNRKKQDSFTLPSFRKGGTKKSKRKSNKKRRKRHTRRKSSC